MGNADKASSSAVARIASLDGLRGVAAFVVVIFHALQVSSMYYLVSLGFVPHGVIASLATYTPLRILWAGPEAVWIFFVLSGFVLSRPYLSGRKMRVRRYYSRRFLRLYLPFLGSFVVSCIVRLVPHDPDPAMSFWVTLHARPILTGETLQSAFLLDGTPSPLNAVWWSLQWEAWFSILLPLVLIVIRRFRPRPSTVFIVCVVLSGYAGEWGRGATLHRPMLAEALRYLPMFGTGIALALAESGIRRWGRSLSNSRAALYALAAVTALTSSSSLMRLFWLEGIDRRVGLLVVGVVTAAAAPFLVALALAAKPVSRLLETGPLQWLGTRSYGLYLIHEPIVVAIAFMFVLTTSTWWSILASIVVALALTEVFWRLVERPSIQLLRRIPST